MNDLSVIEREIIGALLDDAFAAGFSVSVCDGEEWTVKRSVDRSAVTAAIGTTEETALRFRKGDEVIGGVYLVHGNDADVIADHTDCEAIAALLARPMAIANSKVL